jgi:hypothetical protein
MADVIRFSDYEQKDRGCGSDVPSANAATVYVWPLRTQAEIKETEARIIARYEAAKAESGSSR